MERAAHTAALRPPTIGADGEVRFPELDGRRSTTATTSAILADAAREVDPELAQRIESSTRWRRDYIVFLRELTALAAEPRSARAIARAGLDSMRRRLVLEGPGGGTVPLAEALSGEPAEPAHGTGEITGTAAPAEQLEIPYRGAVLRGGELRAQLARWEQAGTVEPSFAEAVELVSEHPEWLSLPGRTLALLGAGSEIGPLGPLCTWGADVLALDLPRPEIWTRIGETARAGAGRLRMPLAPGGEPGLDLLAAPAAARDWLHASLADSPAPVLGMYGYADGGAHVLLSGAFDVVARSLAAAGPAPALAYLATPTDAYLAPDATIKQARAAYRDRRLRRLAQAPAKALSAGRLYRPSYALGDGVADALVEQQGPNYAIAKRLQRWNGMLTDEVSFNVAPATWTRSVTRNRVLACAYAGAPLFGVEIFEPATTRTLMAALLVHDLNTDPPAERAPEQLFSDSAAHGGLWSAAYEPRSVLGLAALAGAPATLLGRKARR